MNVLLYAELPSWGVALGAIGVMVAGSLSLLFFMGEGEDPIEALFKPLGLVAMRPGVHEARTHLQGLWRGQTPMIIGTPPVDDSISFEDVTLAAAGLALLVMLNTSSSGRSGRWFSPPPPTPARVCISGRLPAGLKVVEADAASRLSAWLGLEQDIVIGDEALDKQLLIKGHEPDAVRALLLDPQVNAALKRVLAYRARYLSFVIDEAGVTLSFKDHPGEAEFEVLDALAALGEVLERRASPIDPLAAFGL